MSENGDDLAFDKFMNEIIEKEEKKVKRENIEQEELDSWGRRRDMRYREFSQNRIRYTR